MSVNVETRDKARTFTEKLYKIMEVMDRVVSLIPEGDYLEVVDALKGLYTDDKGVPIQGAPETREAFMEAITNNMRRDPIVSAEARRAQRPIRDKQIILDDARKLENGWKVCPKCDRIVKDMNIHLMSDICQEVSKAKKMAITTGEMDNKDKVIAVKKIKAAMLKRE